MGRPQQLSDHHRLARFMAAHNRLRAQAMDAAYREIHGEAPPAEAALTEADRTARLALARKWDSMRNEIRAVIADGGPWHLIAARLLDEADTVEPTEQPMRPSVVPDANLRSA